MVSVDNWLTMIYMIDNNFESSIMMTQKLDKFKNKLKIESNTEKRKLKNLG